MATVVLDNVMMTSHHTRYLFIYILMSFMLHNHPAVCHSCTDYVPLDVSFIQRALSADIVLYGKDITPPTTNCVQTINQTCERGNITLEVYCIIKQLDNEQQSIPANIEIVTLPFTNEPENNSPNCRFTYNAQDSHVFGDELVVLIRHVTSNIYEWHETHPGLSTSIAASDLDWVDVKRQCLLNNWEPLNDPGVSGNCPTISGDMVTVPCQHGPLCRGDGWTFINDSCYWLSSYDATYEEADGVCQRMDSILVSLTTVDETERLANLLSEIQENQVWWTAGSCAGGSCVWQQNHDFTACCIQEGVEEECLPFCSQVGTQQHMYNEELRFYCVNRASIFHVARCAQGYIPTYECCHSGVLEAKNNSLEAVLTYVEMQCVRLCNLTLLDDLASVLNIISNFYPLGFCGTPHYLSIISMCWGNVTAEPNLPKDLWSDEVQTSNQEGKVILEPQGLSISENYEHYTYNFICEKGPAAYLNRWVDIKPDSTTLVPDGNNSNNGAEPDSTTLVPDGNNSSLAIGSIIMIVVGAALVVIAVLVIVTTCFLKRSKSKPPPTENVYDDDLESVYDSIADGDLDPNCEKPLDCPNSRNTHKTASYLSPSELSDSQGNSTIDQQDIDQSSSVFNDSGYVNNTMCSEIDAKEDSTSRDSALYSGVDSRSESDFTNSVVDNASEYSKLNVTKLQRYDNNLAIRRQTTINVSTESASPVKPRQTKSLLFGISENEQEVTSNSQTNVGYLHESDNSAEAVNEEAIGKMGTEGDNTDKQSLSSDCDTSTSELVEFKTDKRIDNNCNIRAKTARRPKTAIHDSAEMRISNSPRQTKSLHEGVRQLILDTQTNDSGLKRTEEDTQAMNSVAYPDVDNFTHASHI